MDEKTDKNKKQETSAGTTIVHRLIEDEMKQSYLDYSMSVIVGRALPDVRDGLKPVHRRVLFTMLESGLLHNKPFRKSANVVGNCMAKYHPHGDTAIYDTLARMAQDFSLRYLLVEGQGNFGSIDGDNPAAMRYCIAGDSLILTDAGILPIKNISNKNESNINMKILSYSGKKNTATKFFNSGKHKLIQLETNLGYKISGSYNHPIMCWSNNKGIPKIEWKLLENIKKDDIVLLNRDSQLFSKQDLNLQKFKPKLRNRAKKFDLPLVMDKKLAFLLGALISEGSYHQGKIMFSNSDLIFYNKIKDIIYDLFDGIQLYERKIAGNCLEFDLYNTYITDFLKNIGLKNDKSDRKEVPFSVLQSSKQSLSAFLNGLFEGDGSVIFKTDKRHNGKSIELTYNSKSKKLIEQLKVILLNLGVVSTNPYIDKRNGCHKLIISGYNSIKKFKDEINFFSERKKGILSNIDSMNPSRMSKTDYIPYLTHYLRRKYAKNFILKNNLDRYNNLAKNSKRLLSLLDSSDKKIINFILKNKFLFDKVKLISKTSPEDVFSVKVNSKCHSFVANGFINHNTEARLTKLSEEMLQDIEKKTVNFIPNFDNSTKEPTVLPSKVPNLLINGSSGIAVGMATNIPPHNMSEIIDGVIQQIDNPNISIEELMQHIKGPDFPTGATICGKSGIVSAYKTGRGKVIVRAKTQIEDIKDRKRIIVTEIPYMVNKSEMITHIADLIRDKKINGVNDIRDESNREGIRIVIELKKDANADVLLNQLYVHSRLQVTFGIIMVALVNNVPKILNLSQLIKPYIDHRKEVVNRRTLFNLHKAQKRAHILEGLIIAVNNLDKTIKLVKESKSIEEAKNSLMSAFNLSQDQSIAILEMRLQRLTSMEQDKVKNELKDLLNLIAELKAILESPQKIIDIIKQELLEIKQNYGDKRKTEIIEAEATGIEMEDIIEESNCVITITHSGYIKRQLLQTYKQQKRGGKGLIATTTKEEDFVHDIFIASTISHILLFTNKGRVHWVKVYDIPEASRHARGKAVVNLLNLKNDEKVTAYIPIKNFDSDHFLIMATKNGIIKKTNLESYSNPRHGGIIAITLDSNDSLINVKLTDNNKEIILATRNGIATRFNEKDVRATGRSSQGVRGIRLSADDYVIGMVVATDDKTLLTVTENGYGKRTKVSEYRLISRGGSGVKNIICSERNGKVVSINSVSEDNQIMLITKKGITIRMPLSQISVIGRATQGVRLMNLQQDDKLVSVAKIVEE